MFDKREAEYFLEKAALVVWQLANENPHSPQSNSPIAATDLMHIYSRLLDLAKDMKKP